LSRPTSARADVRAYRGTTDRLARVAASLLVLGALVGLLLTMKATAAPEGRAAVRLVDVLEGARTGITSPVGLAFSAPSGSLHVVAARPRPGAVGPHTELVRLTPFATSPRSDRVGSARIAAALDDSINVAFDVRRSRLLGLDRVGRLFEVRARRDGQLDPRALFRSALHVDLHDPQGMTVDPDTGAVFVLDAGMSRILRIEPGRGGALDSATLSGVDLAPDVGSGLRGLAPEATTGRPHLRTGHTPGGPAQR